jgi:hypothetical protein
MRPILSESLIDIVLHCEVHVFKTFCSSGFKILLTLLNQSVISILWIKLVQGLSSSNNAFVSVVLFCIFWQTAFDLMRGWLLLIILLFSCVYSVRVIPHALVRGVESVWEVSNTLHVKCSIILLIEILWRHRQKTETERQRRSFDC